MKHAKAVQKISLICSQHVRNPACYLKNWLCNAQSTYSPAQTGLRNVHVDSVPFSVQVAYLCLLPHTHSHILYKETMMQCRNCTHMDWGTIPKDGPKGVPSIPCNPREKRLSETMVLTNKQALPSVFSSWACVGLEVGRHSISGSTQSLPCSCSLSCSICSLQRGREVWER